MAQLSMTHSRDRLLVTSSVATVYPLRPKCQTYAWGKDAHSSIVARFMALNDPAFVADPKLNYAEVCCN